MGSPRFPGSGSALLCCVSLPRDLPSKPVDVVCVFQCDIHALVASRAGPVKLPSKKKQKTLNPDLGMIAMIDDLGNLCVWKQPFEKYQTKSFGSAFTDFSLIILIWVGCLEYPGFSLRLFAAKVPGAPLMGILFGTCICWIEGLSRGVEHSVFGYPFGSEGDRPGDPVRKEMGGWHGEICILFLLRNPLQGQWMISASTCPKKSLAHHPWMVCLVHFGRALVQLLIQKRLQPSGLQ